MPKTPLLLALVALSLTAACSNASVPTEPSPAPRAETTPPAAPPDPAPNPPAPTAPMAARYTVVFDSTWSALGHPTDFPTSAHYSGLIGGTHSPAVTFWQEGAHATDGIRRMAERGSKQPLDDEVNRAIGAGTAGYLLSGPALSTSPASTSMDFDIAQTHPLVTLVTMVAPSPDWFVGVSGLALFRDGQWVESLRVDLYAFDAGTDSGASYGSPDLATVPNVPISRLGGYPVALNGSVAPFATFTFRRLQ